ncbi:MAG TPA: DUF3011 domain-containing protein [Longimicrobiaceae bacterium]|nr:DUF3011 domain-containing protein [Longimicrobiaceae bacterium]
MRRTLRLLLPAAVLALAAAAPASAGAQQRIRCESRGFDREYCNADIRGGVQLTRQLSDASCRQGRSWGTSSRGIWVSNGCRGEFYVGSSYGRNGGYGGNEPWYGRKDDSRGNGRYGDRGRRDDGRYGRHDRDDRNGRDDRYGRNDGYGRNVAASQASSLCRAEVLRRTRNSRDNRVSVSGASWDSRRDAYLVRWSTYREQGSCEVSGRDGRVRIYSNNGRW